MFKRSQRSGVEDRWHLSRQTNGTPCLKHGKGLICSAKHGIGKRWAARYVPPDGVEVQKLFASKNEAQAWLDQQTSAIATGTYISPKNEITLDEWLEIWLKAYSVHKESTVRQAKVHTKIIGHEFGGMQLTEIRPSTVKTWTARMQDDYAPSTVHAVYRRLAHILSDAVEDGYLGRNPCTRRTAPPLGSVERWCPTTRDVWDLYELMPEHLRVAVLLGAFCGLRIAETAALRTDDVDFTRGVVFPKVQWSGTNALAPLKSKGSSAPIPIPQELALMLSASVRSFPGATLITDGRGKSVGPWVVERSLARVRKTHELDERFEFHTLRHYFASVLIAQGCDVKTVQARMRHASAKTTLDTYGHLWPDRDESTNFAIKGVLAERFVPHAGSVRATDG